MKIAACRELYESGLSVRKIETAMRALGFTNFSSRILSPRRQGRGQRDGWIREFGWQKDSTASVPAACQAANAELPSWTGGVAAVSADGVVDSSRDIRHTPLNSSCDDPPRIDHPVISQKTRNATPPVQEGSRADADTLTPAVAADAFPEWLKSVSPHMHWDWKFQQVLYGALDRIRKGENKRLMINIPPRHGKSELVTVRWIAWMLLNNPALNIILASYNQSLANRFSRKIRQVICDATATTGAQASCLQAANAAEEAALPRTLSDANVHHAGGTGVGRHDACAPVEARAQAARATQFRCAKCRAEAAAARQHRSDTASDSKRESHTCRTSEPVNIDECSKCGAKIDESEPPASASDSATLKTPLTPQTQKMFPFTSSKPINTVSEWGTAAGGGLKAVGVGAGVTGFGGDIIMIDDPVKNRAQAESKTYRERLWDWYTDDLYTRLEPEGSIVLIQTRWHEDDLAGRLIKQMDEGGETWEVVNLPAIAELGSGGMEELGSGGGEELGSGGEGEMGSEGAVQENALKGQKIIAQGKAEGRDPGLDGNTTSDPEGVAQEPRDLAPPKSPDPKGIAQRPSGLDRDGTLAADDADKADKNDLLKSDRSASSAVESPATQTITGMRDTRAPIAKPRVIGYPRLYSKLPSWTGGVAATSADGVVDAPGIEIHDRVEINLTQSTTPPEAGTPPVQEGSFAEDANKTDKTDPPLSAQSPRSAVRSLAAESSTSRQDACAPVEATRILDVLQPLSSSTPLLPHSSTTNVDWRVVGEALCPPRFDVPKLLEIKDQLGTYSFSALYQQHPSPAEGSIFKREWLTNIVDRAPAGLKWFRGYDLAISTKTTADYTASVRVAVDDMGVMYIADGFRRRIEYPEQRRFVFDRIATERDTQHGIEASGNAEAIVSELRRQRVLLRWPFRLIKVVKDKTTRALAWSPRAEEGKLKLVRGPWIDDFVEELASFPVGEHDDQVDAVSVAVEMMSAGGDRRMYAF